MAHLVTPAPLKTKKTKLNSLQAAEKKISNVVAIIIVSFFISWTPYAIVNLLVPFDKGGL